MKSTIVSITVSLFLFSLIIINGICIHRMFDSWQNQIYSTDSMNYDSSKNVYKELLDDFKKREQFLAISINDENLVELEGYISDILISLNEESEEEYLTAKNRLIILLEEIRQLSGFSIKSIF